MSDKSNENRTISIDDVIFGISAVDNETGRIFSLAGFDIPPNEQDFVHTRIIVEKNLSQDGLSHKKFTLQVSRPEEIAEYKKVVKEGRGRQTLHHSSEYKPN